MTYQVSRSTTHVLYINTGAEVAVEAWEEPEEDGRGSTETV